MVFMSSWWGGFLIVLSEANRRKNIGLFVRNNFVIKGNRATARQIKKNSISISKGVSVLDFHSLFLLSLT